MLFAASGPGPVTRAAHRRAASTASRASSIEPRILGAWQPGGAGYRVELRVPLSMLGSAFGVLVDDRDARGAAPVSYGTLRSDDLHTHGPPDPRLAGAERLPDAVPAAGPAACGHHPAGRLLAQADALGRAANLGSGPPLLPQLYRRFVDRPGERQVIQARAPIYDRDHPVVIGTLQVTQTAERWIRLRDQALTRMLNFTLVTSLVVVTAMFTFAAWLACAWRGCAAPARRR